MVNVPFNLIYYLGYNKFTFIQMLFIIYSAEIKLFEFYKFVKYKNGDLKLINEINYFIPVSIRTSQL